MKISLKLIQPFHLVTISPWPILLSFSVMSFFISCSFWFYSGSFTFFLPSMFLSLLIMYQWWRDVSRESLFQGFHTKQVISGLKLGMILFIVSEILFFFSIFWCYFHLFLVPAIEICEMWPPKGVAIFDPYMIPLLNTVILLSSGVTVTWSNYSMLKMNSLESIFSMIVTLMLGAIFTFFQFKEYNSSSFTFSDSSFGSIFFMATGFHGFHVLLGSVFLFIVLLLMIYNVKFSSVNYVLFEFASWYWHFVDVVWLFLYVLVYFWIY